MDLTDEFLRHAADCEQMAKFTRDPASKVTWTRMAERFQQCAEIYKPKLGHLHSYAAEAKSESH